MKNSAWTVSGWADLEGYYGMVQFGPPRMGAPSDWRHRKPPAPYGGYNPDNAGRGLIFRQAGTSFT